jgi:hypothetical protein
MKKLFLKIVVLLLLYVLCGVLGNAQFHFDETNMRYNRLLKRAMSLAEQENYVEAIKTFKVLLKSYPNDLDALYNIGVCYLNTSNSADTAKVYFYKGLEVISSDEKLMDLKNEFAMSLGKTYQVLLQPQKALAIYEMIKNDLVHSDSTLMYNVEREMQICHNAHFFIHHPIEITVENLGSGVNSMYDDHSPIVAIPENQLFFTSRRNWIRLSLLPDGQYAEKIYSIPLGSNWESARMVKVFFKQNEHESAVSLSPDGNEMVLYRNDVHGKSLYLSHFDGQSWSSPEKLPYPINSDAEETHGSVSADRSTFFFTSDRKGGFGGLDIYMIKRDVNGKWGMPRNLGPNINTQYDEETPVIHYDGKTLYFSSEGHNSMGRLDVFYSQMRQDSTWNKPVNMGYPINTPDDDFFFVPTLDKSHAYYASSRFEDNYGGSDIYHVKFNAGSDTELAVVEGKVKAEGIEEHEGVRILVTRLRDDKIVGDYRPCKVSGKYLMFLEVGYEYEVKEKKSKSQEENLAIIDVTPDMSFQNLKNAVEFKDIAMEAPLIMKKKEVLPFPVFAQSKSDEKEDVIPFVSDVILSSQEVGEDKGTETFLNQSENKMSIPISTKETGSINLLAREDVPMQEIDSKKAYTLQLLALQDAPLKDYCFFTEKDLENVKEYKCVDGYTRYVFGEFDEYESSLKLKEELIRSGKFSDIWIRLLDDVVALEVEM